MARKKVYGYVVSGSRVKSGKFFKKLSDAKKEMFRQMKARASQSGIMEIKTKKDAQKFMKK